LLSEEDFFLVDFSLRHLFVLLMCNGYAFLLLHSLFGGKFCWSAGFVGMNHQISLPVLIEPILCWTGMEKLGIDLGFVEDVEQAWRLHRAYFPSKMGGKPAWLDPKSLPSGQNIICQLCSKPLVFLLQIYAPDDENLHCFHRQVIYIKIKKMVLSFFWPLNSEVNFFQDSVCFLLQEWKLLQISRKWWHFSFALLFDSKEPILPLWFTWLRFSTNSWVSAVCFYKVINLNLFWPAHIFSE